MTESKKNIEAKSSVTNPFDIPVEGSLGLLALGAVGIMEWRKVRNAHNKGIIEEKSND
jgi:hypothetical protein